MTSGSGLYFEKNAGGGSGDVVGPGSAVDDRLVAFDGTTGKLIKDAGTSDTGAGKTAARSVIGPASAVGIGDMIAVFNGNVNDEIKSSATTISGLALANGTRPAWAAQSSPPSSPSDGDAWYRTTEPQKLFVYDGTDARWYATETFSLQFNGNGNPQGSDIWLGHHRIAALSNVDRGIKFPFKVHWNSMSIYCVSNTGLGNAIDLYIEATEVHSIAFTGPHNHEVIDEVQAVGDTVRAHYDHAGGAGTEFPQCMIFGREYV